MLDQSMMVKAQGQAAGGEESVTEKEDSLWRRKEQPYHCPLQGMEWKGQITIAWNQY